MRIYILEVTELLGTLKITKKCEVKINKFLLAEHWRVQILLGYTGLELANLNFALSLTQEKKPENLISSLLDSKSIQISHHVSLPQAFT